jgi:hypothetical protein
MSNNNNMHDMKSFDRQTHMGSDMSLIEIIFVFAVFISASGITLLVAATIDNWLGPKFWPKYHIKGYWK